MNNKQASGGSGEDTSGGFKYGGWTASYADEFFGKIMEEELKPADYLLGRKTFEIYRYRHGSIYFVSN